MRISLPWAGCLGEENPKHRNTQEIGKALRVAAAAAQATCVRLSALGRAGVEATMPPRMLFKEHRAPFVAEHRAAFRAAAEAWDASLAPAPAEEGLYETWGNDICHHYTTVGELVGEEANRIEDLNAKNRLKEYIEKRATHRDM